MGCFFFQLLCQISKNEEECIFLLSSVKVDGLHFLLMFAVFSRAAARALFSEQLQTFGSSSAPFSGANLYTWTELVLKTFVLQSHSLTCDVLVPAAAANNESCVVSLT